MSKPKIECTRVPIKDPGLAAQVAEKQAQKWGCFTKVRYCKEHGSYHVTTNKNGRHSRNKHKNQPETSRMSRKRYKARLRLPIETWENEGGAIYGT